MASLTIPASWLHPRQGANGWQFRCSTNLDDLVRTHRAARYFRQLVTLLEDEHGILDYHLKLRSNVSQNNRSDVKVFFGNTSRPTNPAPLPVCISCEPTHELSKESLLSEQQHTRAWLDARGRPKLILTPIRHVERLSELIDENGEMEAFWNDAAELLRRECDPSGDFYPDLVMNHGTYRNHAHLHLKMNFSGKVWNATVAPRHQEQIAKIKQTVQDPSIRKDCFGLVSNKKAAEASADASNNQLQ